ncbi:MAG: tetratricopeptide repeat protein [Deltaproteobacteria bacterium]|nr:tetratricopeptide repeat protein [Deltaproteobacteria bacterium]
MPLLQSGDNLLEKLKDGRFDQVEQCFDNLLTSQVLTLDGGRLLEVVYLNLKSRGIDFELLNKWCASKDAKHSAFVVRGMSLLRSAWDARGRGLGYTVSREGATLMRERALRAKEDLVKAYRLNPSDPNSAAAMVEACLLLGLDEETMEEWFQRALQADPVCYEGYSGKLLYLSPKWGGSEEEIRKVLNDCRTNVPEGTGVCYHVWINYLSEVNPFQGWNESLQDPEYRQQVADVFDTWLHEFPRSTSARVLEARIDIALGNAKDAIKGCTEALEIFPNHFGALSCRGDAYSKVGDDKNAERDYLKLLEISPDNPQTLFTVGKKYIYYVNNKKKAIKLLTKAISLDPTMPEYYEERGKVRYVLQAYPAAIRDFDKAVELNSRSLYSHYYRGKVKCSLGDYEWSQADFKAAIDIDPGFADAYYALAECHDKLNEKKMARENFIKAKEYDPEKYAKSVDKRLKASEEGLRGSLAGLPTLDHTRKIVPRKTVSEQVEPDWEVRAQIQALRRQAKTHDVESAKKSLLKILELDPDDDRAWFELGEKAHYPTKDYTKAIEYYDKAIAINATDKQYFYKRGMSKYYLRGYESAKDDFIVALEIDPKSGKIHRNVGQCYENLGEMDLAREHYLKAKEYSGPSESINNALRRLERKEQEASAVVTTQRPTAKAVPGRTGDKEVKPDWQLRADIQALHKQAAMHRSRRDIESAEKDLLKIVELDPNDHNAWFMLGEMAYYPAKDYAKAIEYYDKAIAINATNKLYLYKRGMSKYYLKGYESAKDDFSSVTRIDPENAAAYFWMGSCFENLGETDLARQNYLKAKEYPAYRESVNLGLRRLEKSKQNSRQPAQIKALREQVDTHLDREDTESAQRDLLKILELDPNDDRAWFRLAEIAFRSTRDYAKAIEYYDKAIAINAANKRYFYRRGLSKYELNDYKSAKDDFISTIQIGSQCDIESINAYYYLGRCFQTLGEKDLARENYLKAKECAPGYRVSVIKKHLEELEAE